MSWFRLDDKFHSHTKVALAGNAAVGLYCKCGSWCADQLTDGLIPSVIARQYGTSKEIRTLLEVGLWVQAPAGGYAMPDYLEFNPSRETVLARRKADADRQRRGRESQGESRRDTAQTSARNPMVPTPPHPLVTDREQPPVSTDAAKGGDNSRYQAIATLYGGIAAFRANAKSPAYADRATTRILSEPDLTRLADLFPTAPPDVVAAWLHGDKHSMAYYQRADEIAAAQDGPEDAPVIPIRGTA